MESNGIPSALLVFLVLFCGELKICSSIEASFLGSGHSYAGVRGEKHLPAEVAGIVDMVAGTEVAVKGTFSCIEVS